MKTLFPALMSCLFTFVATLPANAHEGVHVHPHGLETFALLTFAVIAGSGAALIWARNKK